jgi:Zn-dependent M32 family carboxypeptidase
MSSQDIKFSIESKAKSVSKDPSKLKVIPETQGSSSGPSKKTSEIVKEQGTRLEKLEIEASELINKANRLIKKAENINTATIGILFAIIVVFLVSFLGVASDYMQNNDENRKYFSSLLEKYQTKENSKEVQEIFKDCINTYGLKFCVSR